MKREKRKNDKNRREFDCRMTQTEYKSIATLLIKH